MHASLRIATPVDGPAIRSIYAPYVESTAITFETEVPTTEEMTDRIEQTHEAFPWIVCETENEGVVGIAADESGRTFRRTHRRESGGSRRPSIGVVDCYSDPGGRTDDETVLADPDDLTAVNMQFSSLCDELEFDGVEGVRSGLVTVSPLCAACEGMRDVYRFVSNVTSRNRRSDGLFVCAIDPDADTGEFNDGQNIAEGLSRAFSGRVDLRRDGRQSEVRVEGLDDQPSGWQDVSL